MNFHKTFQVNRAKTWTENLRSNLKTDELKRNRYKLLEINHFLDIQREEFEALSAEQKVGNYGEDEEDI